MTEDVNFEDRLDSDGVEALETLDATLGRMSRAEEIPFMKVARAIILLQDGYGITQSQIAKRVGRGKTQGNISQYYGLKRLIPEWERRADAEEMSFRAAIDISKCSPDVQKRFYEEAVDVAFISQAAAHAVYSQERKEKQAASYSPALGAISVPDFEMTGAETVVIKVYVTEDQIKSLLDLGSLTVENDGRNFELIRLADMVT